MFAFGNVYNSFGVVFQREVLLSSTPLSCGSNCLSLVSEEESPVFWGEFTPGARKAKDDAKAKEPDVYCSPRPRTISLPHRVCGVSCGTEHLLILTFHGRVYSFGKNRLAVRSSLFSLLFR